MSFLARELRNELREVKEFSERAPKYSSAPSRARPATRADPTRAAAATLEGNPGRVTGITVVAIMTMPRRRAAQL
jgi:hypothetical protein